MPDTSVTTFTADDHSKANPKAAMVRVETRDAQGYSNQRKHDLRIGPQPAYVDPDREAENRVVLAPPTVSDLRNIAEQRRSARHLSRSLKRNAGIAAIGIIGFGSEAIQVFSKLSADQQNTALLAAGRAIAEEANTTLEGLVWHGDEATGHAHLVWCGYDLDGAPLSQTMKRGMLAAFQDRLAKVMAAHAPGIERGRSKRARIDAGANVADTIHKSVQELHLNLPADLAAKRTELEEAQKRVDDMAAKLKEAQAKAAAAETNADKFLKRVATYEKRLTDRLDDLERVKGLRRSMLQGAWDRRRAVRDQAAALRVRETLVTAREEGMAAREAQLEVRATSIDAREKATQGHGAELNIRDAALTEKETKAASTQAAINAKIKDLNERTSEVREAARKLKRREDALSGLRVRLVKLVKAFVDTFGLPLPKTLGEAMTELEAEMAARRQAQLDQTPPDSPSTPEDPEDDPSGPGF